MADNRFQYGPNFLVKFPLDDLVLPPPGGRGARVSILGGCCCSLVQTFYRIPLYAIRVGIKELKLLQELIKSL